MEDLTDVVLSEPRVHTYLTLGEAFSFCVTYSLVAEQFQVGDKFSYRQQTYEIKLINDYETTLNFVCLPIS